MALTWPSSALFEAGSHCCNPPQIWLEHVEERFLCLELFNTTRSNVMTPPPTQPHCKLSSHVYRIEACHRLQRDRWLGVASYATRTSPQSSSPTTTDPQGQFVDSVAQGNGTNHPPKSSGTTTLYYYGDVEIVLEWYGTDGHTFSRVRQTYTAA